MRGARLFRMNLFSLISLKCTSKALCCPKEHAANSCALCPGISAPVGHVGAIPCTPLRFTLFCNLREPGFEAWALASNLMSSFWAAGRELRPNGSQFGIDCKLRPNGSNFGIEMPI